MARGRRRKCCRKLFHPDPRNLRHQRYCSEPSCRSADRQGRPQAKPAGSLSRRTKTTSAGPCTSPAAKPSERVIPAIDVSLCGSAMRLKTSQQHKPLVPLAKLALLCVRRYKISQQRNPLFSLA
jgi:hypothetical protein